MNFEFDLEMATICGFTQREAILYSKIVSYKDSIDGCTETISELAACCLCSESSIKKSLKDLVKYGAIIKGSKCERTGTYRYYKRLDSYII